MLPRTEAQRKSIGSGICPSVSRPLHKTPLVARCRTSNSDILILRHPVPSSELRILDVGSGDGLFFGKLAEFGDVDGVELSDGLVNPQGPFGERIQSFVFMFDVLEHLNNPGEASRHAHSLLTPGGALLLTVRAFEILWTNHNTINQYLVC
jgi:2-polyprenyl-3-methyl-5-hydroxy-6-metoxy-1,4-benzoquinol methylase